MSWTGRTQDNQNGGGFLPVEPTGKNWSIYPALQNVNFDGYNITNAGNITGTFIFDNETMDNLVVNDFSNLNNVNVSGELFVTGDTFLNNLNMLGNLQVSENTTLAGELDVGGNITCNRLYFNGSNQNTYLDAQEITYQDPNGNDREISFFFVEESSTAAPAVIQPYLQQPPISFNGTNPNNIITLESQRRCITLNRSGGDQSQTLNNRITLPDISNSTIAYPAIEHFITYNKTTQGNTTIQFEPNYENGSVVSGQLWALATYKRYNTTGSLVQAAATTLTGTGNISVSNFKGFITQTIKSLRSPNGDGAYCITSEAWEQP